jgi:N-acetylgalactosamine-N,N'-diacetylbacillosaminyl-diphospho-undecaprenol 4-alpha-N-acetylgalactosaminyltransferase
VKKVAIFIYSLGGGGAERVALELASGLNGKFEVEIITVSPVQNYDIEGFKVVSLYRHDLKSSAYAKLFSVFKVAAALAKYCRQNKIDTMISFLSRPTLIAALAKVLNPKLHFIATEHTTLSNYYGNSFAEKVLKKALSLAYFIADEVVAVSNGIKEDLSQNLGVKKSKITVIYNPVDIQKIRILALQKVQRQSDGFIFVTAGRLVESKNYPFLFEAFKLLPSFCRLWVLGDGELAQELRFKAVELGIHDRVHFFGFCENPYSYFAAADCFVMASRLEGLPTVQIEALACGLPVISTDCKSGPREILSGAEEMLISGLEKAEYGVLVGLDNPRFLSLAMQKIIDDDTLREGYKTKAVARAEFFSKEKSLEAYKKLIIGA